MQKCTNGIENNEHGIIDEKFGYRNMDEIANCEQALEDRSNKEFVTTQK